MLFLVVEHLVVDFIGKKNESVLTRDLRKLQQYCFGINRPRWIIGINHHNRFGARGNFGAQVR